MKKTTLAKKQKEETFWEFIFSSLAFGTSMILCSYFGLRMTDLDEKKDKTKEEKKELEKSRIIFGVFLGVLCISFPILIYFGTHHEKKRILRYKESLKNRQNSLPEQNN